MWVDLRYLDFLGLGEPACFYWELCLFVSGPSSRSSFQRRSSKHQELWDLNWSARPPPCCHDNVFLSDHLWAPLHLQFRIFSSSRIIVCTVPTLTSNCALIIPIDTWRSLSMKFFIWPINSSILTSLLLPHLSSSFTDSLPPVNLLCYSKTDAQFMQDGRKAVWSILYVSVAFFPNLKQDFFAYRPSKVSSRPDCIFEIPQLWQSGFSRVYSNWCCRYWCKPEIIEIGQSSHKLYSNKILNFQVSTTILNACNKKCLYTYWRHLIYVFSIHPGK